jgi:hypothetical protein
MAENIFAIILLSVTGLIGLAIFRQKIKNDIWL